MIKYIFLGVIQGLTEFLPVSSSGHLVIAQRFLGIYSDEIALSVVLHLGTILALVIFFFKNIIEALRSIKMVLLIFIVTAITGVIGILGKDFFESLFSSPKFISLEFALTGAILFLTRKFQEGKRSDLNKADALLTGFAQAVSIIPAISRSGMTISALLFRKIDRQTAFNFSFLASIPAILGVALLEARKVDVALNHNFANLVYGFIASFITGVLALIILKFVMQKAKLHYFSYYCFAIAIITLLFLK